MMKKSESSFDSQSSVRKLAKTPSTTYSASVSPLPFLNIQEIRLLKNLEQMQSQLAQNLKNYSESLGLKVRRIHFRFESVKKKQKQLTRHKVSITNRLKSMKIVSSADYLEINVNQAEKDYDEVQIEMAQLKKQLQNKKKKQKEIENYRKKDLCLQAEIANLKSQVEKLRNSKKVLAENSKEISTCSSQILKLYEPSKAKIEELLINKEELILSIPQLDLFKQKLEQDKENLRTIFEEGRSLHHTAEFLQKALKEKIEHLASKKSELKLQNEKFHARLALIRVEERFIMEKKAKIELVKKEIECISAAFDNSKRLVEKVKPKSRSTIRICKASTAKSDCNKTFNK